MGFKVTRTDYRGGKNILASEHFQYIEGGATLDGAAFGDGPIPVGTLIARDTATGKFVPFTGAGEGTYDNHAVLDADVVIENGEDEIVGQVVVRGSVYADKLPEGSAIDAFAAANPMVRFVRHI